MDTFKRLKLFYLPYKGLFIVSIISLLFVTAVTVSYPLILQFTIDEIFIADQFHLIPYAALVFFALMLVKGVFLYFHQYCGDLFGIRSVYELRNALYNKLQFLPFRFYDNARTGDLMSRLAQDVEAFRFFLSFGFAQVLNFVSLVGLGFAVMLYLNVQLALVTLMAMPFLGFVVYRFDKQVHPAFKNIRLALAHLTTKVQENVSGMSTVKALSKEDYEVDRFTDRNLTYKERHIFTAKIWASFFPLMELIGHICVVALLAFGGWLVLDGQLTTGSLIAFFSLVWFIIGPMMGLGFMINLFSQSKAAGERLLEVLDENEDIRDLPQAVPIEDMKGHVRFDNVTLKYPGEDTYALKDIHLDAAAGKVIALVGPTGSGKTSLTQLICRFYEPTKGSIELDGQPLDHYTLQSLRREIGIVLQEPFLFSSKIKDNISYGRPQANMAEIMAAAKRAQAHAFIMELPDQYETVLGERGRGLSGGQRQRLSIARALLLNPRILILDDATSAVDMETEHNIQEAMREVMQGRTTFIIAHRISSVRHADEILVFDQGKIVQRGTHAELLGKKHGSYRRIYDIQYRDRDKAQDIS